MLLSELLVSSLFFNIHLAINTAAAASAICYFPDGSVAKDHEACLNINSPSACCEDGSICMTNGFCLDHMSVSRHSCTDQTWQDPACPLAGGCYTDTTWNHQTKSLIPCPGLPGHQWSCDHTCAGHNFSLNVGDLVPRASQLPPSVPLPVTIQAEASVGSAINTAIIITSATSAAIPKPSCLTTHTEINKMGSRTAIIVGVAVGAPLALLAAALAILLFLERRKTRAVADGSSKKDLNPRVEAIVRNQASYKGQAEEAMIKHTMTSAVNNIHDVEEQTDDLHSHGQIVEADIGGRDDRAELV